jgi:hypothetical protein
MVDYSDLLIGSLELVALAFPSPSLSTRPGKMPLAAGVRYSLEGLLASLKDCEPIHFG